MCTYLIDDDPISLFLTQQMLRLEGTATDIRAFTGAKEALAQLLPDLTADLPQIIFLDLNMPIMSGWDFLEALEPHASALRGRCHIYVLTSSLAQVDTAKARGYTLVSGVIHKPLDEDEVRVIQAELRG